MNKTRHNLFLLLSFLLSSLTLASSKEKNLVPYPIKNLVVATIDGSINPATLSYLQSAYKKAASIKNSAVLIKLNTPGGMVSTTKDILTLMGNKERPTLIWVTPEGASATSAGAIISSGAHFLFMSEGTNIGAATPVQMGADIPKDLRNKAINDLVALVTSLSEARNRNPKMFANMIEKASSYKASEALKQNIINGITSNLDDIFKAINKKAFSLKGKSFYAKIEKLIYSKRD